MIILRRLVNYNTKTNVAESEDVQMLNDETVPTGFEYVGKRKRLGMEVREYVQKGTLPYWQNKLPTFLPEE